MKTTLASGQTLPTHVPDQFFSAYVEAALWSSTYSNDDDDDECLNLDDVEHELAPETSDKMLSDCADFLAYCEESGLDAFPDYGRSEWGNAELSGHDFWLTRNGHDAGYWDRGLGDIGDALSDAAKTFGTADLYVGDDGLIYQQ